MPISASESPPWTGVLHCPSQAWLSARLWGVRRAEHSSLGRSRGWGTDPGAWREVGTCLRLLGSERADVEESFGGPASRGPAQGLQDPWTEATSSVLLWPRYLSVSPSGGGHTLVKTSDWLAPCRSHSCQSAAARSLAQRVAAPFASLAVEGPPLSGRHPLKASKLIQQYFLLVSVIWGPCSATGSQQ